MSNIMPPHRYRDEYSRLLSWMESREKTEDETLEKRWKKIVTIVKKIEHASPRNRRFSIKHLNALEKYQPLFRNEERAIIVRAVELLEKLLLHKKINREF